MRRGSNPLRPLVPGWRRVMLGAVAALGGWPGAAGLTAAAVAGITIGVAAPEAVELVSGGILTTSAEAEDFLPSYAALLMEDG